MPRPYHWMCVPLAIPLELPANFLIPSYSVTNRDQAVDSV